MATGGRYRALITAALSALSPACNTILDLGDPVLLTTAPDTTSSSDTSPDTDTETATGPGTTSQGGPGIPGQASACGDGRLDPGEQCDDGNTQDLDGCDDKCQRQTSFFCNYSPNVCFACPSSTGCGPLGQSRCCDVVFVPARPGPPGTFVPSFYLDRYEVTVARFQLFIDGYIDWIVRRSCSADQAECHVGGDADWVVPGTLATLADALSEPTECDGMACTCTRSQPLSDILPISCVSWGIARAFCDWEGGRLPTAAEWRSAATNGGATKYPWGTAEPGSVVGLCKGEDFATVNGLTAPTRAGAHRCDGSQAGAFDLVGNLAEWVEDGKAGAIQPMIGGSFRVTLQPMGDNAKVPVDLPRGTRRDDLGFRCAHDVPGH